MSAARTNLGSRFVQTLRLLTLVLGASLAASVRAETDE
jgi:hypothetical protein